MSRHQEAPGHTDNGLDDDTTIFVQFQKNEITAQAMLEGLKPMLKKIASSVAMRFANRAISNSAADMSDELFQEMSILLITNIKEKYDPTLRNIGSYLYSSCRNTCHSHYQEEASHYNFDPTLMINEQSSNSMIDELSYEPEFESLADRSRALDRARQAIQLRTKRATTDPDNPLSPITMKPIKSDKAGDFIFDREGSFEVGETPSHEGGIQLPPLCLELKEIMDGLAMDYQDAAIYLNLKKPTLAAYLYGRTINVPAEVMATARIMRDDPKLNEELDLFTNKTMSESLSLWMSMIGLEDDQFNELAEIIGVHRVTIDRWRKEVKPSISNFRKHHRLARSIQERMKRN